jgi:hypothetical protein
MILGLKLGRRLMAAAALDDEQFVWQDSRFAPSRRSAMASGLTRYFSQLLTQVKPEAIYYYAPTGPNTLTEDLIKLLVTTAGESGIPVKPLSRLDVFGSFGLLPLRTRRELRDALQPLWPVLSDGPVPRQVALAEAAAAALVGDLQQAWPP